MERCLHDQFCCHYLPQKKSVVVEKPPQCSRCTGTGLEPEPEEKRRSFASKLLRISLRTKI